MVTSSSIKHIGNKAKRGEVYAELKKNKTKEKIERRMKQAKAEKANPELKKERLAKNIPKTLENTREWDPATLPVTETADPELNLDVASDPFAGCFQRDKPPQILITTSPQASKATYNFCDELVQVFPASEFRPRKKGRGFEIPRICQWAAKRDYTDLMVINEDHKEPNAITIVHLPDGPTSYFKLTSVMLSKSITGKARATAHLPELVLNNFSTRLGLTVGRVFQSLFPVMPEFQGRQVVTLHNQRDFLFFRRHRYAFRSTEKAALQEIGPRFTLKLKWLKKGVPQLKLSQDPHQVQSEAEDSEPELERAEAEDPEASATSAEKSAHSTKKPNSIQGIDEYEWKWRPELDTSKRKFFL